MLTSSLESINSIYDNFLARFQFFRDFVKILIGFFFDLEKLNTELNTIRERIEDLEDALSSLKELVEDLDKEVDDLLVPKSDISDTVNSHTAHSILSKYQEAYRSSE